MTDGTDVERPEPAPGSDPAHGPDPARDPDPARGPDPARDPQAEARPEAAAGRDPAATFEDHRGLLLGVAYRVLGSVSDAEDVVQETWLRWSGADHGAVREPRAFLTTTATRLALNTLRARRNRRETYAGPWLPEPVLGGDESPAGADPAEPVLLAESVSLAFLVVLESLTPLERVAFVLHDLFGFEYPEIARTLERSEPAVRQLVSRSRRYVRERRPRAVTDAGEHARITAAFMRAAVEGDLAALLRLLAPDVVLVTDSGGAVKAARRPINGSDKVARFLAAIAHDTPGVSWELARLNGRTGVLVHAGDELIGVVDLELVDGRISAVRAQLNPAKLAAARG